jgi:hypothetical protein
MEVLCLIMGLEIIVIIDIVVITDKIQYTNDLELSTSQILCKIIE